ncbi:MAG: hypothetical protein KDD67_01970 [Ignavibacteriae bacterium]|nr:hypothetical protein [Ignavibacteriota bacterium]MCB9215414.1 hypothetical protein [Ignavibacteria bacterium]
MSEPIAGVSLEQYAELCALMGDTGGDVAKENAIAADHGVSADAWKEAKEGYTARMSDPSDMGKTAMAFMPLYQAAQEKMRGGGEPASLETYTKVHAEMAFRKDDDGNKIDYNIVLAEHGFTHQSWLEVEGYWTPRVGAPDQPKWDPELGQKFREMMQAESDRIFGIVR